VGEDLRPPGDPERGYDSSSAASSTGSQGTLRLYEFGPFRLNPAERTLLRENQIVPLTPKAFDTLLVLVLNSGHLVEKEDLLRLIWPGTFVEEGSLSNNIFVLRKALGEDPAFIETVPKRGYRFVGAVRQLPPATPTRSEEASGDPRQPANEMPEHSQRLGVHSIANITPKAQPLSRSRATVGIALVVLLASLAAEGWFYRFAPRGETIDSLVVLPFVNAGNDPNAEFLSDGITESITNRLSGLPHLRVMSRDAAFRYKGKETDARTVGQALGVRAVLKGRVTQRDDALDISAELVDARDDSQIWGEQYRRKTADIFELQSVIAKEIATALRIRLSVEDEKRIAKSSTTDPEAYQDYLKGRYSWNKFNQEGLNKAIEFFQRAIARDPHYALAYSGLADTYSILNGDYYLPPMEVLPKAKEAALKAVELDDTSAEAHASLGIVKHAYDWDWAGAEREYQRAIELNPAYEPAQRRYGLLLMELGRKEEAIAKFKQSLDLDPLSVLGYFQLGMEFYFARQYDRTIEQERKALELAPNYIYAYDYLGAAYLQKSMYKESIAEYEKMLALSPGHPRALADLGNAYAVAGRTTEARRTLDQLNELSKHRFVRGVELARIYVGLGDKDEAFECLQRSYDDRSIEAFVGFKVDPRFDPLRSDPRFQDLLHRMNLQP
jgi:TolB-like protein/DNA-binding winged helix-turn-helix (wHTH) protein/Flp pilus assembly protein TadD